MSQDPWQNPNNQQQGFPAAPPAYPAYPGGAYGAPMPAKPPMPKTVKLAVNLMFAGMAIGLIHIAVGLAEISKINDHLRDLGFAQSTIDSDKNLFVTTIVVGGLIGAGLWLWMALACRAGHNYARIVSTVFFGLGVLGSISNMASSWVPALDKVFSVLTLLAGLLSIIFVWNKESGPYFRRPAPGFEYAYQQPPMPPYGQPPQAPQPPYGQPPQQPPYGQG